MIQFESFKKVFQDYNFFLERRLFHSAICVQFNRIVGYERADPRVAQ